MAMYNVKLPTEIMKEVEQLAKNTDKMLGNMTKAGAKVVEANIRANVPSTWKNSKIMDCLKITKTYKTPSDDGINTKVAFYGYFVNKNGVKTPAPLVANVAEYGKKGIIKTPFLRKSFNEKEITEAMLKIQQKYIK